MFIFTDETVLYLLLRQHHLKNFKPGTCKLTVVDLGHAILFLIFVSQDNEIHLKTGCRDLEIPLSLRISMACSKTMHGKANSIRQGCTMLRSSVLFNVDVYCICFLPRR